MLLKAEEPLSRIKRLFMAALMVPLFVSYLCLALLRFPLVYCCVCFVMNRYIVIVRMDLLIT